MHNIPSNIIQSSVITSNIMMYLEAISWSFPGLPLLVSKSEVIVGISGQLGTSAHELAEKHPWYSEQLTFLMVNTDNNAYLTKDEFFEAAKVSPDMQVLNFSYKQLENLVDGLIAIGDQVIIYAYLNPYIAHNFKLN